MSTVGSQDTQLSDGSPPSISRTMRTTSTLGLDLMGLRSPAILLFTLSLLFPPWSASPDDFKLSSGLLSIFGKKLGYVDIPHLILLWLLVAGLALVMVFTRPRKAPLSTRPLDSGRMKVLVAAIGMSEAVCLLYLGRDAVASLDSKVEFFAEVTVRLVLLSRVLPWLVNSIESLKLCYMGFLLANFGWDLHGSLPELANVIAGLIPLYLLVGDFLFRFDSQNCLSTAVGPGQDELPAQRSVVIETVPEQEDAQRAADTSIERFRPPST